MMLGGGFHGQRLNKPYKESVTEPEILAILKPMITRWAKEREDGERFGDWTIRAGYVKPTLEGKKFWDDSAIA
jgi:sulfite reductase (NADPH) hemoprotein beta-component